MLTLHWATHHRTIELLMSIEAAARDILRASQPIAPAEPPERPWECGHCEESNPESFEICWQCDAAAMARVIRVAVCCHRTKRLSRHEGGIA